MPGRPDLTPETIEANLGVLDFAIFEHLPDEGSHLGYHPLFKTVRQLTKELNDSQDDGAPPLKTTTVSTRLRVMRMGQLAVAITSLAGSIEGWQRSHRAKALLELKGGQE